MKKSKYNNVCWDIENSKWRAIVAINGATHHLGRFVNQDDANQAVCKFKQEHGLRDSYSVLPPILESFRYDNGRLIALHGTTQYKAGDVVGHLSKRTGYTSIRHNNVLILAHRVIWELLVGPIPSDMQIDHINRNRSDNRIENLRLVEAVDNAKNHSLQSNNKTGVPGIKVGPGGIYLVNIGLLGKQIHLGSFRDFFDACCARKSAEVTHRYHANHGRLLA